MGTETVNKDIVDKYLPIINVKLNNPLMGTETYILPPYIPL